jgi:hypothetical protein
MNSIAHVWPMDPTARRRPMVTMAGSRAMVTTVRMWPMVIAAISKPRKKNCRDYKKINKQDYKEINKQATNARLLRLLHILHPLGIKVRHQCKYREQKSSILHILGI